MQNKGQFFLIATFIVITLFLSLTLVYNFTSSPAGDSDISSLVKNLKFEGINIINNGYNNNLNYDAITLNLKDFTTKTSSSFRVYNITIITISEDRTKKEAYNYVNGNQIALSADKIKIEGNKATLNLNTLEFNFNLSRGYNFFVIAINEKQNERYIASE